MSGTGGSDSVNVFITAALVAGIIAVLAFSFYYEIQISGSSASNRVGVPVVTVTATKIVIITQAVVTSCSTNQTSAANQTTTC